MPIPVNFETYASPTIDLASIQQNQQRINMAKQQQQQEQFQNIINIVGQIMKQQQQQKMLKQLGITKEIPITKEVTKQPVLADYQKIMESMGGGVNIAEGMPPNKQIETLNKLFQGMGYALPQPTTTQVPTGKYRTEFSPEGLEKLPAGMEMDLSAIFGAPMTYKRQQPNIQEPKTPSWGQEQKVKALKEGLKQGRVILGKQFGEPSVYEIKTGEDAYKAILEAGLDPSLFAEELGQYKEVIVKDKQGREYSLPKSQLNEAIKQGYVLKE